ncbi:hypothetical protein M422DRAFT_271585 [Sphaerobolus stellatus SS14]|uniref:Uncharacterized protein n=1 Tax=Sphaerobolus stellatus (strain SS14) TaxID=990650 RepID=A0A0C9TZQ5_SPHS4|nr:hypothetical protein M422DRAFT_271585 [Sphaerobolus stellatus SS14]
MSSCLVSQRNAIPATGLGDTLLVQSSSLKPTLPSLDPASRDSSLRKTCGNDLGMRCSIGSLASVDIIASDKTGTLTANQVTLHEPWVPEGVDVNWISNFEASQTIGEAQKLRIKVKMLTGDTVVIAKETCCMLNLGTNVCDSQRLSAAAWSIHDFVEGANGFAIVAQPQDDASIHVPFPQVQRSHIETTQVGDTRDVVPDAVGPTHCSVSST